MSTFLKLSLTFRALCAKIILVQTFFFSKIGFGVSIIETLKKQDNIGGNLNLTGGS